MSSRRGRAAPRVLRDSRLVLGPVDKPPTPKTGAALSHCLLPSAYPGHVTSPYPRQQINFNSVISSTTKCGPSRPIPLFLTPP